jgi:hypothetical protein
MKEVLKNRREKVSGRWGEGFRWERAEVELARWRQYSPVSAQIYGP